MRRLLCVLLALLLTGCAAAETVPHDRPEENAAAQSPDSAPEPQPEPAPEPELEPEPNPEPEPDPAPEPEPAAGDFVRVRDYIPDIQVELRYATDNNFTGQVIYPFTDAYLRYGTVKKLADAQRRLAEKGCSLKLWDAFRPTAAQWTLWSVYPDPVYVADPERGYSSHSRGSTVDVTLTDLEGNELPMPTGFDDFTKLADRDYSDVQDETARANALLLEQLMEDCGFTPYQGEWWHFSDSDVYPVEETFTPPSAAPPTFSSLSLAKEKRK